MVHRGASGRPRRSGGTILGVDLGATNLRAALVDLEGRIVRRAAPEPVVDRRPAAVLAAIGRMARELDPDASAVGVGISVAAQVDAGGQHVRYAPNLGWQGVPVGRRLSRLLGVPVVLTNDARAATWAEWKLGRGRGCDQLFVLVVGTGVGGGAVVDGHWLSGSACAVGEIGHVTIVAGGRKCTCPNAGCLEAYAGGWAIAERAREAIRADPEAGEAVRRLAGSVDAVTSQTIALAAVRGDPLAVRLREQTAGYLADGAVSVVNAFNPELVLLVGGVVDSWPGIGRKLEGAARRRCQPPAANGVRIRRGALGSDAPLLGAALRAHVSIERGGTPGQRRTNV